MTDHSDLIEQIQAAAEITGDELLQAAASALSSQSLSLSEARVEIERLRCDIAVKAKLLTKSAKETRAFWDALIPKGGRCRECADFDGRCQGDGPPCDPQAHALENLAKLQSASPDLSSLRKGAEVVVKPLEWEETYYQSHDTPPELTGWEAEGACGYYHIKIEYTGFEASLDGVSFFKIGTFDDPDRAKSAAQSDFETRIRSALVSGSREDGDG